MKIKKRYIWTPIIFILICNSILGGIWISFSGVNYKFTSTAHSQGEVYPRPELQIYSTNIDVYFLFHYSSWRRMSSKLILLNGFTDRRQNTPAQVSAFVKSYAPDRLAVSQVLLKTAYIKRENESLLYDLLEQYPPDKRIFNEEFTIELPFSISEGDTCYIAGTIYLNNDTQFTFSTEYKVEKINHSWDVSFFLIELIKHY